jgi:hypothetical protein
MYALVKVTFKPWEEVIIHEAIKYSLPDLIRLAGFGVQPGGLAAPLHWAEGVVFHFIPMPPTDDVVKESLQGKVHWLSVAWALMPEYKDVVPIGDINAKIPIINVSATASLCEVIRALKEQVK